MIGFRSNSMFSPRSASLKLNLLYSSEKEIPAGISNDIPVEFRNFLQRSQHLICELQGGGNFTEDIHKMH